jgi:CDP-diacylglycerol--glycerol-3-phosphate 3-phosphatidyltransferase
MPSRFRLRKIFAPVVKKIAEIAVKFHVTPNGATWLMLACAICSHLILTYTHAIWGFGLMLFITGIMDGVDGAIARLTNSQSKFGGFFDSTMDRVSEGVIFGSILWNNSWLLALSPGSNLVLIGTAFVSSNLISYTRARLDLAWDPAIKRPDSNIGLMGRSERLFFLFILSLLTPFFVVSIFPWGFGIFTLLVCGTALFRIMKYRSYLLSESTGSY